MLGLLLVGKKFNMPDGRNDMPHVLRGRIAHLGNDVKLILNMSMQNKMQVEFTGIGSCWTEIIY